MQAKRLRHANGQSRHHPDESRTIMASSKSKKDIKRLDKGKIGPVEEVGLGQGMLQTESVLEAQLAFGSAKVCYHLDAY